MTARAHCTSRIARVNAARSRAAYAVPPCAYNDMKLNRATYSASRGVEKGILEQALALPRGVRGALCKRSPRRQHGGNSQHGGVDMVRGGDRHHSITRQHRNMDAVTE